MSELVSIVLPIYNVSKYLDKCITTIVNQTYKNLEIILVDDGSTDQSPSMCDEWVKKDGRIKVIHKQNGGLGNARNTGIDNATGKYIFFIDSDDYVSLDLVSKCYNSAKSTNADIVIYGFSVADESEKIISSIVPNATKRTYTFDEIQNEYLPSLISNKRKDSKFSNLHMSAWACMYSLKLIKDNNWAFVSEREIISEDVYSLLGLYKYVNKVCILEDSLYFYRKNGSSLSHTYREDRFLKINKFYLECLKLAEELNYSNEIKKSLTNPYFSNVIGCMKILARSNIEKKQKKKYIKNIIKDKIFKDALNEYNSCGDSLSKKILIFAMKKEMTNLCYGLISLKLRGGKL